MGPYFVQKTKRMILKKKNLMKGLVSVHFFHVKRPINDESHDYKVTN